MYLSYSTYLRLLYSTLSESIEGFTGTLHNLLLKNYTHRYEMSSAPTPTVPSVPLPLTFLGELSKVPREYVGCAVGLCLAILVLCPLWSDRITKQTQLGVEKIKASVEEQKIKQLELQLQNEAAKLQNEAAKLKVEEQKLAQLHTQLQIQRELTDRAATTSTVSTQPTQPSTPDQRATSNQTHHSRSPSLLASPTVN
ncbi:hypothetical protein BAUCODRAFT_122656 [Baudoinia panamericana UAMH 10762]|uniref:Uncharacterized protein n=1 Tax=Baudoinia panamericana (strain UAMH 10762) TaxID=717646 RepID=M2LQG9_BAUPA|nr:uncharacterized protein BAUCODRAFT_122656 [Baudoinia panamericana UAMH 10762]EMC96677.1 hypothetical protein BAUCODRAFT_122656 [Baudoinia panamericana UAMH 10762]